MMNGYQPSSTNGMSLVQDVERIMQDVLHKAIRGNMAPALPLAVMAQERIRGNNCVYCERETNCFCENCKYPFCSTECLFEGRKIHMSFCGNLKTDNGAVKKAVKPLTDRLAAVRLEAPRTDRANPLYEQDVVPLAVALHKFETSTQYGDCYERKSADRFGFSDQESYQGHSRGIPNKSRNYLPVEKDYSTPKISNSSPQKRDRPSVSSNNCSAVEDWVQNSYPHNGLQYNDRTRRSRDSQPTSGNSERRGTLKVKSNNGWLEKNTIGVYDEALPQQQLYPRKKVEKTSFSQLSDLNPTPHINHGYGQRNEELTLATKIMEPPQSHKQTPQQLLNNDNHQRKEELQPATKYEESPQSRQQTPRYPSINGNNQSKQDLKPTIKYEEPPQFLQQTARCPSNNGKDQRKEELKPTTKYQEPPQSHKQTPQRFLNNDNYQRKEDLKPTTKYEEPPQSRQQTPRCPLINGNNQSKEDLKPTIKYEEPPQLRQQTSRCPSNNRNDQRKEDLKPTTKCVESPQVPLPSETNKTLPLDVKVVEDEFQIVAFWGSDEKGGWWVNRPFSKPFQEISAALLPDKIEKLPKICERDVKEGLMCVAPYCGDWYRARVISVQPEIKVEFIDFGNQHVCDKSELLQLPAEILSLPHQAFFVNISKDQNEIVDSEEIQNRTYMTKFLDVSAQNLPIVELLWEVLDDPTEDPGDMKDASAVRNTIKNDYQAIAFWGSDEKGGWWANRPFSKAFLEIADALLPDKIDKMPKVLDRDLKEGLMCVAPYCGDWYRARIFSVHPEIKVDFIDFGNKAVCDKSELLQIPNEIINHPQQAIFVKLTESQRNTTDPESLQNRTFMTKLSDVDATNCPVVEVLWEILDEPSGNFPPNSVVTVTALVGIDGIAVHLPGQIGKYEELNQSLASKFDKNVLVVEPSVGDIVLAFSQSEKEFRRAQVRSAKTPNGFLVQFIDYGNISVVHLRDMRALPPTSDPPGALCIWPQLDCRFHGQYDLTRFYERLILNKTPLTLVYDLNPYNGTRLLFNGKCCSLMQYFEKQHPSEPIKVPLIEHSDLMLAFESADPLDSLPAVGTVAVVFCEEDQNYHRARILRYENDDVAVVELVASRKTSRVRMRNLRVILEKGEEIPRRISVNEETPIDLDGTLFECVPLDQGSYELYIAHVDPEELFNGRFIHVMNLKNRLTDAILGEFFDDIQKYCTIGNGKKNYYPKISELCFAYFEGVWVRAICLNNSDSKSVELFLIDIGKIVQIDSCFIQPKAPWAADYPAAVSRCIVYGAHKFTEDNFPTVLNVLRESTVVFGTVRQIRGEYIVEVPLLGEILRSAVTGPGR